MTDLETVAAAVLVLAVVASYVMVVNKIQVIQAVYTRALLDLVASNEVERRELLERIQRPERIPPKPANPEAVEAPRDPVKAASYSRVGQVRPPLADPPAAA